MSIDQGHTPLFLSAPLNRLPAGLPAGLSLELSGGLSGGLSDGIKTKTTALELALALGRGRVHEVLGAAADSFAVVLASQVPGPIVWIGLARDVGTLTPMALCEFFDPSRVILIEAANRKDVLWATEQALRCRGAGLVVAQLSLGPDLTESRRLQLAAEQRSEPLEPQPHVMGGTARGLDRADAGALGLILIERRAQASAAQTRWICDPLAANEGAAPDGAAHDEAVNEDGPNAQEETRRIIGPWLWTLTKNKAGQTGRWIVTWERGDGEGGDGQAHHVHMAACSAA